MRRLILRALALAALTAAVVGAAGAGPVNRPAPEAVTHRIGVAVGWPALADPRARDFIGRHFGSITPENEMKMDALQPVRGRFTFDRADAILALAEANGQEVRGHILVWHRQLPLWVTGRSWTRPELLAVLREHVRTVVAHFRGRIAEWDVVNEPLAANGELRDSLWLRVIGPSYIDEALRAAHEADPGARLLVNEFNAERPGPKLEGLRALVQGLRARGVPLDGVGLQGHVRTDWHPTRAELAATLRGFTRLGLTVSVTELDVATNRSPGSLAERMALQAGVYGMYAGVCAEVAGCRGVTVWGLTDAGSWLGPEALALPFTAGYSPKPAWDALVAAGGS